MELIHTYKLADDERHQVLDAVQGLVGLIDESHPEGRRLLTRLAGGNQPLTADQLRALFDALYGLAQVLHRQADPQWWEPQLTAAEGGLVAEGQGTQMAKDLAALRDAQGQALSGVINLLTDRYAAAHGAS